MGSRRLAEYAMLDVDRREEVALIEQHLGFAEHQESAVFQREVETREDARLRFGGEIHQGVPADKEVEPRDRRVLDEIVPAEDDHAAQVAPNGEGVASGRLEIFFAQRYRDRFDGLVVVRRAAGAGQRIAVDVSGVDLDELAEEAAPLLRLLRSSGNCGGQWSSSVISP